MNKLLKYIHVFDFSTETYMYIHINTDDIYAILDSGFGTYTLCINSGDEFGYLDEYTISRDTYLFIESKLKEIM